jgi:hypothetical protein
VPITRQKSLVFSIVSLPTDSVIVDHAVEDWIYSDEWAFAGSRFQLGIYFANEGSFQIGANYCSLSKSQVATCLETKCTNELSSR